MVIFSPHLFAFRLVEHQGQLFCWRKRNEPFGDSSSERNFSLARNVVTFHIPFALLAILYPIILMRLNSQTFPGEQSTIADELCARRNRNVLKMAIAILLGFVLCWVPWSSIELLGYFVSYRRLFCGSPLYSVILPRYVLRQFVPLILLSASFSVQIIVKVLRDS